MVLPFGAQCSKIAQMPRDTKPPAPLPSAVFVQELAAARGRKGLTQQQLADRLEALSAPIDRSTIGKIEAGKRGVSVDEIFYFARALGISPLSLIVPRSAPSMRVTPIEELDVESVLLWVRNIQGLPAFFDDDGGNGRFFHDAKTDGEANSYRKHPNLASIVVLANALLVAAAHEADRSNTYRDGLMKLGAVVQREWEDIGQSGSPVEAARGAELAFDALVANIYKLVERD
jgi:transcriptional regulator with XRE-family HTH domain